ncbi:integral membrane protein [Vibrio furnissii]|nr:integral membrane protein [Vibrio furnissii]
MPTGFSKTLDKHHEPGWGVSVCLWLYNYPCPNEQVVSVLAISITTVALAEIGDKTQLLSLLLASRYRKPIPIIAAIFLATIANHALAAWLGVVVADYLSPEVLKWVLVVSFLAMAAWVLIPDKIDDDEEISNRGPFVASFIAFFVAEIGDKTQIATSILGAQYADALSWVVLGTTIGMLLANVPVVLIGKLSADKMPLGLIRKVTAALFAALAVGAAVF